MNSNGSQVPYAFNFLANNSGHASASNTASFLSALAITTDGSTAPATGETSLLISGDGTNSTVYLWTDNGNGTVAAGELSAIATLSGVDNDNFTGAEFLFNTLAV